MGMAPPGGGFHDGRGPAIAIRSHSITGIHVILTTNDSKKEVGSGDGRRGATSCRPSAPHLPLKPCSRPANHAFVAIRSQTHSLVMNKAGRGRRHVSFHVSNFLSSVSRTHRENKASPFFKRSQSLTPGEKQGQRPPPGGLLHSSVLAIAIQSLEFMQSTESSRFSPPMIQRKKEDREGADEGATGCWPSAPHCR